MGKPIDITGQVFGKLTVLRKVSQVGEKNSRWLCECNCRERNQIVVLLNNLTRGHTISCGCVRKEKTRERMKKYNTYDLSGSYGIGYTFDDKIFYFDLGDYDKIKNICWRINSEGYVVSSHQKNHIYMHRLVTNCPSDMDVDHQNHITHDNRKENLRICSTSRNLMNHVIKSNNTSGVTGVYWIKRRQNWRVDIGVNGKSIFIGYFNNFDEAVKARKEAEEKYFGEFSYDNSMKEDDNELQQSS